MDLTRRRLTVSLGAVAVGGQAHAQTAQEIQVSLASTSLVACLPRIAAEMGLFQKRGIQPRFILMDSANAATAALIAGSVRMAVSGPGELVVASARGQKVVLIANIYGGLGATLVLGKDVASPSRDRSGRAQRRRD